MKSIRVLIFASNSLFAASTARDLLAQPGIEIAASVFTDRDAIASIDAENVDVVLCDVRVLGLIPRLFVQRAKARKSTVRVVMLAPPGQASALRAMADEVVVLEPVAQQRFAKALVSSIKSVGSGSTGIGKLAYSWQPGAPFSTHFQGVVALGASAGGTEATDQVLRQLPANFPGLLIAQHMPPGFTRMYAERLDKVSRLSVREAQDWDEIRPGCALVAPGGVQMRVVKAAGKQHPVVRCAGVEKISGHCPSVDALFLSVAEVFGARSVGVILTGMGSDGAEGLLSMRRKGAFTIGQDEVTSMVYGMPRVAFQKGAVEKQLPLDEIPLALCSYLIKAAHGD